MGTLLLQHHHRRTKFRVNHLTKNSYVSDPFKIHNLLGKFRSLSKGQTITYFMLHRTQFDQELLVEFCQVKMSTPAGSLGAQLIQPAWNFRYHFPNFFLRSFMFGMVGTLAMYISSWEKADRLKDQFQDKSYGENGESYDFIIVGGGTAGSLVAYRLAKTYNVLLLEAGGDPHPFQSIPFMANFMRGYPELDWMHTTVPQKYSFLGSEERRARISQGKGLGGTSNLDYMMVLRGSCLDYDHWANITNDKSWNYDSVLPYFMKHEDYEGPWKDKQGKQKRHGTDGEVRLAMPPYSKLAKKFVVAGNEMGYPYVDLLDLAEDTEGFDMLSYPMNMGYRQTAYKSFLRRAVPVPLNLVIHKYAHVNKILFRGENNEAYGVEYERHGKLRQSYAKKEIIVSAGSIQTPKIIMLSGIGDTETLQSLGIPVKVHLPEVGKNLQDHVGVHLGPFFTTPGETLVIDRDVTASSFVSYTMGQGLLTTTGYEASAMLISDSAKASAQGNPHWPDIQLTMYAVGLHETSDEDYAHAYRLRRSLVADYYNNSKNRDSFSILVSATRPKSRGAVKLKDNNPLSHPLIDPNYLKNIDDVGVILDGIKKAMKTVETTVTFRKIETTFTNRTVQGCSHYRPRSDEYWACFIRVMTISMGDVVGTMSMGKVVDTKLRLKGTKRLRIIDASIMPTIVSGGASAATMMIGEKGADLILKYWGQSEKVPSNQSKQQVKAIQKMISQATRGLRYIDPVTTFLQAFTNASGIKDLNPRQLAQLNKASSSWSTILSPLQQVMQSIGEDLVLGSPSSNQLITSTTDAKKLPMIPSEPFFFKGNKTLLPPAKKQYNSTKLNKTKPLTEKVRTTIRPTTENIGILFGMGQSQAASSSSTASPSPSAYVLDPKTTTMNSLLSFYLKPTEKTFISSVEALLRQQFGIDPPNPYPNFGKTLPVTGLATVNNSPNPEKNLKVNLSPYVHSGPATSDAVNSPYYTTVYDDSNSQQVDNGWWKSALPARQYENKALRTQIEKFIQPVTTTGSSIFMSDPFQESSQVFPYKQVVYSPLYSILNDPKTLNSEVEKLLNDPKMRNLRPSLPRRN